MAKTRKFSVRLLKIGKTFKESHKQDLIFVKYLEMMPSQLIYLMGKKPILGGDLFWELKKIY